MQQCDKKNEYRKIEENKNENVTASSDSGFCSSDAEDSVTDDDDGSTCSLDELFVEEVEDLRTENRISSVVEDYEGDFGIFTKSDIKEWKKKEEILLRRYAEGY